MTVKALRKQLMAAIAMVVVSAVALSSSTYAWFASNNKVSATGMQVQAKAEGGIEIAFGKSTEASGTFATSATAGMSNATYLLPTSTTGNASAGVVNGWYYASAQAGNASAAKNDTRKTLSLSLGDGSPGKETTQYYDTNGNQYYLVKNFVIRSTSASTLAKGLKVDKVSVAGAAADMSKAIRVAVVVANKSLIYAPYGTHTTPYTVYSGFTGSGDTAVATVAGTVTLTDANTSTLIGDTAETTIPAKGNGVNGGVDVAIYTYFEGEDADLYSEKFVTEGLTVTVDFSADIASDAGGASQINNLSLDNETGGDTQTTQDTTTIPDNQ